MNFNAANALQVFQDKVAIKFQLYNSLFTSLPFHRIEKTGVYLSLLLEICSDGYNQSLSPEEIINDYFQKHTNYTTEQDKNQLLFRLIQFIERQVVLFDAIEDAAFLDIVDVAGPGTLKHLTSEVIQTGAEEKLENKLKEFSVRLVLTAHPTQFYPRAVLGIITDLSQALKINDTGHVNMYLQQLGKTPFLNKQKPTPYDEAMSLLWFLENVFYDAAGRLVSELKASFPQALSEVGQIIQMGFWPGGDRDGNPNVSTDATLKVAEALRTGIIRCYYRDISKLKQRLTFKGVDTILAELEAKLYNNIFIPGQKTDLTKAQIIEALTKAKQITNEDHRGLFVSLIESMLDKVDVFGLHFATLDVRQESTVHNNVLEQIAERQQVLPKNYPSLSDNEKIDVLTSIEGTADVAQLDEGVLRDTLESVAAIKIIQQQNGEEGCSRYIISQCNSALNVIEVYGLFLLNNWKKESLTIDIVPLFETVPDLINARGVMTTLYENETYKEHLKRRNNLQTIMLGFSDGTKDGGYLAANWSIYKAKKELTAISKNYGIDVVFFDGRGGPPARGGGKSHKFYASMGKDVANKQIQLTIQGQTVSTSYGNIDSAQFNIEQLLNAGINNGLFATKEVTFTPQEELLMQELADDSLQAYLDLKNHPLFMEYLSNISPLKFFGETNIGSRPAKRGGSSKLSIKDLRAIPFVGSWSQLKQNVTGYYGVGIALEAIGKRGRLDEVKKLYKSSLFFRTLIDNCEMSMKKCFFPLTAFLANHPVYGEMWNLVNDEYNRTQKYVLEVTGKKELMADYPVEQLSIQMREKIVIPLLTIQQYAMAQIRRLDDEQAGEDKKMIYQQLAMRCSFGIINAGRNSA
jgi:phosphoenolpyruvate carboxylase